MGVNLDIVSPEEAAELHPFLNTDGLQSAIYTLDDGSVDPASVTQAMAIGARNRGATIYRNTLVTGIELQPNSEWLVNTDKGDIRAEHVVNAAGFFGRQVGEMVGLNVPIVAMEHQYLITEDIPEIVAYEGEFPTIRDSRASMYARREQGGLCIGVYETESATPFCPEDVPFSFGQQLLQPNMERQSDWYEKAMECLPCFASAGIKQIINGPQSFTPTGAAYLGPAPGLPNFWLACGSSVGITQGGGSGKMLAQFMIEGEAEINLQQFDSSHLGVYATREFTAARCVDIYEKIFHTHCPYEETDVGRLGYMDPLYDRLKEQGASFGETFGWEKANWFAPEGMEPVDELSFRRTNWHEPVGQECKAARERVGVVNLSFFGKMEVTGPGAGKFLNSLTARKIPEAEGRVTLAHYLNENGGVVAEHTITKVAENCYYLLYGLTAREHDFGLLKMAMPDDGSVSIKDVTEDFGSLLVTGPEARKVLAKVTDADLSNDAFPWLTAQNIEVAGVPVRAMRVSYAGELGWELHVASGSLLTVYDAVMEAGAEFDIANIGTRALNSLRMEKAYRALGTEPPRVYRRLFCSRLRRLYQGCSGLHRMRPPVLVAAGARSRRAAACCCTS